MLGAISNISKMGVHICGNPFQDFPHGYLFPWIINVQGPPGHDLKCLLDAFGSSSKGP